MLILMSSAALVGFVHSLAPGHWLPVVLLAKARRWKPSVAAAAALVTASGHILLSILLAAIAIRAGDATVAEAHFAIETSIVSISPTSGPVGTPITIHLKGVGWTEYDNIYIANYDNAYMGYACGFNSQGDVVVNFTASGAPGVHLIDLYPGIYQGPAEGQPFYRLPQLTYADDHPGNRIPALRFAFEVTDGPRPVNTTR